MNTQLTILAAKGPDLTLVHNLGVVDVFVLMLVPLFVLFLVGGFITRSFAKYQKTDAAYAAVSGWGSIGIWLGVMVGPWVTIGALFFNNWYWTTSF